MCFLLSGFTLKLWFWDVLRSCPEVLTVSWKAYLSYLSYCTFCECSGRKLETCQAVCDLLQTFHLAVLRASLRSCQISNIRRHWPSPSSAFLWSLNEKDDLLWNTLCVWGEADSVEPSISFLCDKCLAPPQARHCLHLSSPFSRRFYGIYLCQTRASTVSWHLQKPWTSTKGCQAP